MTDENEIPLREWVEFAPTPSASIAFHAGNKKPLLTLHQDGSIEIGEGMKPDDAGRQAVDGMIKQWRWIIDSAVAAERDRCAKIADDADHGGMIVCQQIAAAIRARSA